MLHSKLQISTAWGLISNEILLELIKILNQPYTASTDTPKLVTAIPEKIVQISLGAEFSLVLDEKGNVWAWGTNSDGQCGPGHFTTVNEPICILKGMF